MNESCVCVKSEYDKKRLKVTLNRYNTIKDNAEFTLEADHLYVQLCGYSEEDFREVGEVKPKEVRRVLGKSTLNR